MMNIILLQGCKNLPNNKNTLNIALENEVKHLDPKRANDLYSIQIQHLLYRRLFKEDTNKKIIKDLVKSYTISNNRIIKITLKDAFWSDGKKIIARDFETDIKNALSPKFPSSDISLLYIIKNAKKAKQGFISTDKVKIDSVSDNTLIIELEQKDKHLIKKLSSLIFSFYRKDAFSGPYCIEAYKPARHLLLSKNLCYENHPSIEVENLKFYFLKDVNLCVQLFLKNKLDIIGHPFIQIPILYKSIIRKNFSIFKKDIFGIKLLGFNCEKIFKDKNFRKTISSLIKRDEITQKITEQSEKVLYPIQYDNHIAKSSKISLIYSNNETNHLIAQHIQKQLESNLKIKVLLQKMELNHLLQRLQKKDFDCCLFTWFADYSDFNNIFERLKSVNHYKNFTGYELKKNTLNYTQQIIKDLPILPLFQCNFEIFAQKKIKKLNILSNGIIQIDKVEFYD
jgi:oligopeptide transport system substrate-binding protein